MYEMPFIIEQKTVQQPIQYSAPQPTPVPNELEIKVGRTMDFSKLMKGNTPTIVEEDTKKKKPISRKTMPDGTEIISAKKEKDLPMYQSNVPYVDTFTETNLMLRNTIAQTDQLANELKNELDSVRTSKTLKGKYQYVGILADTIGKLLNTKMSAVKEINSVIAKGHDLDLKRYKDLNSIQNAAGRSDEAAVMDMYNSFISMPGLAGMNGVPSMQQVTSPEMINRVGLGGAPSNANFIASPEMLAMTVEKDPNIAPVVMYDRSSGRKWFEVINTMTGEKVNGITPPSPMFIEDLTLDLNSGWARNTNLNTQYRIVPVGNEPKHGY